MKKSLKYLIATTTIVAISLGLTTAAFKELMQ
jgi:hypothetical protein